MGRIGSYLHEVELKKVLSKLENEGYRVFSLSGLSPDGIAVKEGKVVAVEVLGLHWREVPQKRWHRSWTYKDKRKAYSMFDDVIISTFQHPKSPIERKDRELIKETIKGLLKGKALTTSQIRNLLPFTLSIRRVSQILVDLKNLGVVDKVTVSSGRHGRFNQWFRKE